MGGVKARFFSRVRFIGRRKRKYCCILENGFQEGKNEKNMNNYKNNDFKTFCKGFTGKNIYGVEIG